MDKSKKPVGIWIRVSTEDQAKGESPEHHEKRALMYAEVKGWEVKEVYRLGGVSGKSVIDHPEAKCMMADIKSGHITGLIFSKLARLARSTKQLLEFSDYFQTHNADLVSLQEAIDTSTPAGRLFYTIIAAMAQWEREEIADRVKASIPVRAKMGKNIGGQAPYGYRWNGKTLELDPVEAPIRKLMFELYLEHKRIKRVARILNERGYRTRKGGEFVAGSMRRHLNDPMAKGLRRVNYTQSLGKGKSWKLKEEDEWIFVEVPAIVSAEVWDKVNQILEENGQAHKKPNRGVVYLFGGYVHCACGTKMYVRTRSPKYTCRSCKNKMEIPILEEIFHEQLKAYIVDNDEITLHLDKASSRIRDKEELIETLKKESKKVQERMDHLIHLSQTGQIPVDGFGKHYQPLHDQYQQIEQQIPELAGEIDFLKIQLASSDDILSNAHDLYERWPTLDFKTKRSIIEAILDKIEVGEDEIEIHLHYLPTLLDLPNNESMELEATSDLNSKELVRKGVHNPATVAF